MVGDYSSKIHKSAYNLFSVLISKRGFSSLQTRKSFGEILSGNHRLLRPSIRLDNKLHILKLQLRGAIYRPDSFASAQGYCANLKAIRYESTSLNRTVADKSHCVIVALRN